ncbi:MAG: B-box zinc finger protein [Anaerolineales bacterium]|nr:B-box zinc finger protein [Anaerolineales bacterium]
MTASLPDTLYCANHPQMATQLRCNKCGKPICAKCIVRTPVGYRCRECMRQQQQVFETAVWSDYLIAGVIAAPLAGLAGLLSFWLGFLVLFLAPVAGGVIAEIVRWAVRRRRGRYLSLAATGAFVLGCLPLLGLPLLSALLAVLSGAPAGTLLGALVGVLWPAVYCALGASALFARLRGISV